MKLLSFTLFCLCLLFSCKQEDAEPNAVLRITPSSDSSLKANASDSRDLTIHVDKKTDVKYFPLSLETTLGSFSESDTALKSVTFTPDANGDFKLVLYAGFQAGQAILTAKTKGGEYSVSKTLTFTSAVTDSIFKVALSRATSAPADGGTKTRITVTIPEAIRASGKTIRFSATAGTLSQTQVPVVADGRQITVDWTSPLEPGQAVLEVSMNGTSYFHRQEFTFTRAYPTHLGIELSPSDTAIELGTATTINVRLSRDSNAVSINQPVDIQVKDSLGTPLAQLYNIKPSDATGVASATFVLRNAEYRRHHLYISAAIPSAPSVPRDTVKVKVK